MGLAQKYQGFGENVRSIFRTLHTDSVQLVVFIITIEQRKSTVLFCAVVSLFQFRHDARRHLPGFAGSLGEAFALSVRTSVFVPLDLAVIFVGETNLVS